MRLMVKSRPELLDVKRLFKRNAMELPQVPFPDFQHGIALIAREPGDTVRMVFLSNPNPNEGSVALYAGWTCKIACNSDPLRGDFRVQFRPPLT
jgi:hypothetical protein